MARSSLFASLRRLFAAAEVSRRTGRRPEDVLAAARRGPTRRDLIRNTAGAAVLLPLAACGDDIQRDELDVAVIGGGIAGLHCAYRLAEAGIEPVVFESSSRTGGRMFTARGEFPDGQICELGGELVDTGHATIMSLASDFGLQLDELATFTPGLANDTFYFDGAVVAEADIVTEFTPLAAMMSTTVSTAEADDAEFARIDNMSIPEWLGGEAGLPTTSLLRRILELAYTGEYGLEADDQSIFNMLYLIDYDTPDPFRIFGDSDERFHIHAGNDSIPTALAEELTPARIRLEHTLTGVVLREDNRYDLNFDGPDGTVRLTATHVVFALPFTRLRGVDLSAAGISAEKQDIIDNLGYGTNAKLMLGFESRPWTEAPRSSAGGSFSDVGELQSTWDSTRGQDGARGILTNFVGGDRGLAIGDGDEQDRAAEVIPWVDTVFPGAAAAYTEGSAVRMHWPTHPHTLASYASYRVGQWAYYGLEGQRERNLHFCGEHTSLDFQGYMEGGAETGMLVAAEIIEDVGAKPSPRLTQLLAPKLALPQATFQAGRFRGERRRWRRNQRRRLG
jgi:monoamine oxidase